MPPYLLYLHNALEKVKPPIVEVAALASCAQALYHLVQLTVFCFKLLVDAEVVHQFKTRLALVILVERFV